MTYVCTLYNTYAYIYMEIATHVFFALSPSLYIHIYICMYIYIHGFIIYVSALTHICIRAQGQRLPRKGWGQIFSAAPPPSPGQKCMCICIHKLLRMHLYTYAPVGTKYAHVCLCIPMSAYACTRCRGICMSVHPYMHAYACTCIHIHNL